MNHIDTFFSKLKSSFVSFEHKKRAVAAACLLHSGIIINPNQIEIRGQIVRLNITPGGRSTIFLKKMEIIESLKGQITPAITEIR